MSEPLQVSQQEIDQLYQKLNKEAEASGYHLNPDVEFTKGLVLGLLKNEKKYGYQACPCRRAVYDRKKDLDIICPCDYRDPDLNEYDMCYCGLYVTTKVLKGEKQMQSIPERRPSEEERNKQSKAGATPSNLSQPVWRCKVCGYLCARPEAPDQCPICKVPKDRFERFM